MADRDMQRQTYTTSDIDRESCADSQRDTERESYIHCQRDIYRHNQTATVTYRDICRERERQH